MDEKIPAAEFAAARGIPEPAVVHRIKSGIYDGLEEGGEWFVIRRRSSAAPVLVPGESALEPERWEIEDTRRKVVADGGTGEENERPPSRPLRADCSDESITGP